MGVAFLLVSLVWGVVFFSWIDKSDFIRGILRLVFGWGVGIIGLGFLVLFFAVVFGNLFGALLVVVFGAFLALLLLAKKVVSVFVLLKAQMLSSLKTFSWLEIAFGLIIYGLFALLSIQSMLWDSQGFPYGVLKGWGDGAYHLSMVQHFAAMDRFVLDQPVLSGKPLTYPFFVNFLSAVFLRSGFSFALSWHLPTLIFGLIMVFALLCLAKVFFSNRYLAFILVVLVFFGAGFGFLWFFQQVGKETGRLGLISALKDNLLNPRFEYTHLDIRTGGKPDSMKHEANIVWIVPLISFFSHQRSFVLGAALGFLILGGFWHYFKEGKDFSRWLVLLGFLFLIHFHTLLAFGVFFLTLFLFFLLFEFEKLTLWRLIKGGAGAFLLGLPAIIFLLSALFFPEGERDSFFLRPWFGWMTCGHSRSWFFCDPDLPGTDNFVLWFWLKNFGAIFIGWVIGVFCSLSRKEIYWRAMGTASIIMFVLPNLFLFQPWEFDNNKFLFWWWVLAVILGLSLFDEPPIILGERVFTFWRFFPKQIGVQTKKRFAIRHWLLIVFVVSAVFSGALDVWGRAKQGLSINKNKTHFGYYGRDELLLADWIKRNTEPDSVFLASFQPNQFIPITTGRPVYLGYPGWLWTQGSNLLVEKRQERIRRFLITGKTQELCAEGVRYWLKEPQFFRDYPVVVVDKIFQKMTSVFSVQDINGTREIFMLHCE